MHNILQKKAVHFLLSTMVAVTMIVTPGLAFATESQTCKDETVYTTTNPDGTENAILVQDEITNESKLKRQNKKSNL